MTDRDTPTTSPGSLTPEQFLAQFAGEPDHHDPDDPGGSAGGTRGSGPVEDDRRRGGTDRPLEGNDTRRLSAQFAVPETVTRPPLPPKPDEPGRDRRIPSNLPRTVLHLSDDPPADS